MTLMAGDDSGCDKVACQVVFEDVIPSEWMHVGLIDGEARKVQTVVRPGGWEHPAMVRAAFIDKNPHVVPAWYGSIEWNPSRVVYPDSWHLAPMAVVPEQWKRVADHALDLGAVQVLDLDPKLKRLDLARDFSEVAQMGTLMDALVRLPVAHSKRATLFVDQAEGHALTMTRGSGEGMVRAYDQGAAKKELGAPKGLLRVELQARERWLARAQSGTLSEAVTKAETVYRERWEWARMGTQVETTAVVRDRAASLMDQGEYSRAVTLRCFGEMMWRASGAAVPEGSKNSAAQYNRWLQDMGVTLSATGTPRVPSGRLTTGLDLDSGRTLTVAA